MGTQQMGLKVLVHKCPRLPIPSCRPFCNETSLGKRAEKPRMCTIAHEGRIAHKLQRVTLSRHLGAPMWTLPNKSSCLYSEECQKPQPPLLLKKVSQYTSHLYCNTPPMCTAVLSVPLRSEEREILSVLLSHWYRSTPPICIAIPLPFVSQYFGETLGGCGHRNVPHVCHILSPFVCHILCLIPYLTDFYAIRPLFLYDMFWGHMFDKYGVLEVVATVISIARYCGSLSAICPVLRYGVLKFLTVKRLVGYLLKCNIPCAKRYLSDTCGDAIWK